MGPIGMQEMIGLFVIALLLFGPKKLPELGRTLGKALTEFRRAKNEFTRTFETHMQELERETQLEPVKELRSPTNYSYPYDDYGRYEEPVAESATPAPAAQIEAPHPGEQPVPAASSPVPGTVARNSNGHSSVHPVTAIADQEHPS